MASYKINLKHAFGKVIRRETDVLLSEFKQSKAHHELYCPCSFGDNLTKCQSLFTGKNKIYHQFVVY